MINFLKTFAVDFIIKSNNFSFICYCETLTFVGVQFHWPSLLPRFQSGINTPYLWKSTKKSGARKRKRVVSTQSTQKWWCITWLNSTIRKGNRIWREKEGRRSGQDAKNKKKSLETFGETRNRKAKSEN